MNLVIKEENYNNIAFQTLCQKLDDFQNELYPERTKLKLSALDGLEKLEKIYVIYNENEAIACGGIKPLNNEVAELARMYTSSSYRGQGLAKIIIERIIEYAKEKGYKKIILDTWKKSESAKRLYMSLGFKETIPFDTNAFKNSFSTNDENIQKQIQNNLVFMELDI